MFNDQLRLKTVLWPFWLIAGKFLVEERILHPGIVHQLQKD